MKNKIDKIGQMIKKFMQSKPQKEQTELSVKKLLKRQGKQNEIKNK